MPEKITNYPKTKKTDFKIPEMIQNPFAADKEIVQKNLSQVKNIIAVHSGKGGVGKTTIAINLAVSLSKKGFKVGLLDADIDCPSINKFLGIKEKLKTDDNKRFIPIEKFGLKTVSIAFIQSQEDQAHIYRGPIISGITKQLLQQSNWGELDYLILDLPPGTSDTPLTIMQLLDLTGFIIVTTSQDVAVVDAKKSINMAKKLGQRVIGIIENMSGEVFGKGGGENTAKEMKIAFLGRINLHKEIRKATDNGVPAVEAFPELKKEFDLIIDKIIK